MMPRVLEQRARQSKGMGAGSDRKPTFLMPYRCDMQNFQW
ncbi:hypothetical protein PhaeoP97_01914 [Phaeobacter porticola]|uniref:Uncharacterized protein n=1 Tax=Phaeobacter porticola TaxID=1844006 RepID=A0A1L3I5L0_9RHOB|nr:hypothetical protein PhaeoP97_01914 [Phaeobacter porticola]